MEKLNSEIKQSEKKIDGIKGDIEKIKGDIDTNFRRNSSRAVKLEREGFSSIKIERFVQKANAERAILVGRLNELRNQIIREKRLQARITGKKNYQSIATRIIGFSLVTLTSLTSLRSLNEYFSTRCNSPEKIKQQEVMTEKVANADGLNTIIQKEMVGLRIINQSQLDPKHAVKRLTKIKNNTITISDQDKKQIVGRISQMSQKRNITHLATYTTKVEKKSTITHLTIPETNQSEFEIIIDDCRDKRFAQIRKEKGNSRFEVSVQNLEKLTVTVDKNTVIIKIKEGEMCVNAE